MPLEGVPSIRPYFWALVPTAICLKSSCVSVGQIPQKMEPTIDSAGLMAQAQAKITAGSGSLGNCKCTL